MGTKTLERVSAMPAPTWHSLKMNDATVEIDEALAPARDIAIETDAELGGADAFDAALDAAQADWDAEFGDAPVLANYEDEQANRLGGLALSEYQKGVDAAEASKSLRAMYEQGMGEEAARWLAEMAGERTSLNVAASKACSASVLVRGIDASVNTAALDVIVDDGATLELAITVDSPVPGYGITGTTLRIFAGKNAHVTVRRVQTLDDSWTDLDDMGLFLSNGATIEIFQTVLGAGHTYTGLAGDLRGKGSTANVTTHYLGHGEQELDFNYVLRHHGRKTTCNLYANGVLAGESSKVLRGTIDLIRGCKGAQGQETDNVLLVDEAVKNKTVPTILCNEDDVAGNHGATIGHIREEQLFYLASRGLSREDAEGMFVSATLEDAWLNAANEDAKQAIVRLGNTIVEDFEEAYL